MRPTTAMDPFDGFDDAFGVGGADVFGHALNDFDIWGDDDEGFNPGSSSNNSTTKEFPGDDFTVGTETMSSSDRSSRTFSPKNVQRRSSRTLDTKSRTTMIPKTTPSLPISFTQSSEKSSGHDRHQQHRQEHGETGIDKSNSIDSTSDDKNLRRTPLVRRHSSGPRRQCKTQLGRETSIRQLVSLLDSSDANLDAKDLEGEAKEENQKIGPVVSKSVMSRSLRTKSRSIRNLSDQTNDPRCGGDSLNMNVETEKELEKSHWSETSEDELKKASNRLRDSSRPQLSRSNSGNRKTRDELRNAASRHLTNSRPSLSMNTGSSATRIRRASSMIPSVLTDSTNASSTFETKSDEPEHSNTTTKREPSRRNLTRSTSFNRRKAPSRHASLTTGITSPPGDSNPPKLSLSDDEVLEDQSSTPQQEHSSTSTRREPPRRGLTKSTSFGRRKSTDRIAPLKIDRSLGDSNPKLSLSDDEVLQDSQFNNPEQERSVATTKRDMSRRSFTSSTSFRRRQSTDRNGTLNMDSSLGDSNPPRLSLSDDEVFQDLQFDIPKQEHSSSTPKREPSRRNLTRSTSFNRRKTPSRHASLTSGVTSSPEDSNPPRLSSSDDEVLEDLQFDIPKQEHSSSTPQREPSRRNLTRSTSFNRRKTPSRHASLTSGISSSPGDSNLPRPCLSDDEVLEDLKGDNIPKLEPSNGNLRQSMSGRRKAPLTQASHHG